MVASSASKVEVSWNDLLTGNLPTPTPAQQLFTETVITVAAQAKAALPGLNGRVERARDLVLGFPISSAKFRGLRNYALFHNGFCDV